jgi:hypothetical protein
MNTNASSASTGTSEITTAGDGYAGAYTLLATVAGNNGAAASTGVTKTAAITWGTP